MSVNKKHTEWKKYVHEEKYSTTLYSSDLVLDIFLRCKPRDVHVILISTLQPRLSCT